MGIVKQGITPLLNMSGRLRRTVSGWYLFIPSAFFFLPKLEEHLSGTRFSSNCSMTREHLSGTKFSSNYSMGREHLSRTRFSSNCSMGRELLSGTGSMVRDVISASWVKQIGLAFR
ncbi:hypothetical protein AVEN_19550-1 [Araneus ventricosus]|uniref:Uncharacterized protein n=1 Tax=Araneus ventricosus TaxID=182803 RepID=A0A4Y2FCZ7_ARAVE|nr:hypothetical protein AVEN_237631-1 [Araneus ventricosus]GBM38837.1 hypothetical protein AVEN_19550-1 [Araneus ventricosus]